MTQDTDIVEFDAIVSLALASAVEGPNRDPT